MSLKYLIDYEESMIVYMKGRNERYYLSIEGLLNYWLLIFIVAPVCLVVGDR